jgi:hypothetical protein
MDFIKTIKSAVAKVSAIGAPLDEYLVAAIVFVVIGVAVSIGAYITSEVQVQVASVAGSNSIANQTAGYAVKGMQTFGQWLPILAIVVIAAVIIALLYGLLGGGNRREGAVA